jgi:hypothetical protein
MLLELFSNDKLKPGNGLWFYYGLQEQKAINRKFKEKLLTRDLKEFFYRELN